MIVNHAMDFFYENNELSEMIRDFISLKNIHFSNKSIRGVFMKFSLRPWQTTWPHQWPSVLPLHVVLHPVSGTRTGGAEETTCKISGLVGELEKQSKKNNNFQISRNSFVIWKGSRRILLMSLWYHTFVVAAVAVFVSLSAEVTLWDDHFGETALPRAPWPCEAKLEKEVFSELISNGNP